MIPNGALLGLIGLVLILLLVVGYRARVARSDRHDGTDGPSRWQLLALIIGICTVGMGVTARVAPERLTPLLQSVPLTIPQNTATIIATGASMIGLGLLAGLFRARSESTTRHTVAAAGIETIQIEAETQNSLGKGSLQRDLDRLRNDDETTQRRERADRDVRTELREQAIAVLQARGYDQKEANDALSAGTWTLRRDIAAFLGGTDAPSMPLTVRLQDWLSTQPATVRRAERTIAELERVARTGTEMGGGTDE